MYSSLPQLSPDVPTVPGKPLVMSFSSRTVKLSWAPPLNVHSSPVSYDGGYYRTPTGRYIGTPIEWDLYLLSLFLCNFSVCL